MTEEKLAALRESSKFLVVALGPPQVSLAEVLDHIDDQGKVIANLRAGLKALTPFIRCSKCGELWVAQSCINFKTGSQQVLWTRPKPTRAAHNIYHDYRGACKHQADIEQWNGEAWAPITVNEAKHAD